MLTKARLKLLRSLTSREARRREGLYLVEGRRLVEETLRSDAALDEVLATPEFAASGPGAELLERVRETGVPIASVPARDAPRLSDTKTPQGIFAMVRLSAADPAVLRTDGLFLALDGVSDPGNVGTLIRAADAFGVRAVLSGPGTADFENPKVLRAAMGSTFHVPHIATGDLPGELRRFGDRGGTVLAATLDGGDLPDEPPASTPCCVVLGSEAHGVSPEVRDIADRCVTIPSPGRAESLNVAMAGAILLFHMRESAP